MKGNKLSDEVYSARFRPKGEDVRGPYFRDQTAIIHSLPFRRLKRKTQVFFAPENDHICTRVEHAFHVFTNSTTLCKGLRAEGWSLDVEMTQAIALGHDLGHPPFGHAGEEVLNEIMRTAGCNFHHEINSLRVVDYIADKGEGLKLTFGVRDGIVSHCGESIEQHTEPDWNISKIEEIKELGKRPSSYEGCIVRVADKISSLGRDVEDAIQLGIITPEDIPEGIIAYLRIKPSEAKYQFNRGFLNRIIYDIIEETDRTEKVGMSEEGFRAMNAINDFSISRIYNSEKIRDYRHYVRIVINNIYSSLSELLDGYTVDLHGKDFIRSYAEFGNYIKAYSDFYEQTDAGKEQILADYISGMSDNYAISFQKDISIPKAVFK
jgi:dGTPase